MPPLPTSPRSPRVAAERRTEPDGFPTPTQSDGPETALPSSSTAPSKARQDYYLWLNRRNSIPAAAGAPPRGASSSPPGDVNFRAEAIRRARVAAATAIPAPDALRRLAAGRAAAAARNASASGAEGQMTTPERRGELRSPVSTMPSGDSEEGGEVPDWAAAMVEEALSRMDVPDVVPLPVDTDGDGDMSAPPPRAGMWDDDVVSAAAAAALPISPRGEEDETAGRVSAAYRRMFEQEERAGVEQHRRRFHGEGASPTAPGQMPHPRGRNPARARGEGGGKRQSPSRSVTRDGGVPGVVVVVSDSGSAVSIEAQSPALKGQGGDNSAGAMDCGLSVSIPNFEEDGDKKCNIEIEVTESKEMDETKNEEIGEVKNEEIEKDKDEETEDKDKAVEAHKDEEMEEVKGGTSRLTKAIDEINDVKETESLEEGEIMEDETEDVDLLRVDTCEAVADIWAGGEYSEAFPSSSTDADDGAETHSVQQLEVLEVEKAEVNTRNFTRELANSEDIGVSDQHQESKAPDTTGNNYPCDDPGTYESSPSVSDSGACGHGQGWVPPSDHEEISGGVQTPPLSSRMPCRAPLGALGKLEVRPETLSSQDGAAPCPHSAPTPSRQMRRPMVFDDSISPTAMVRRRRSRSRTNSSSSVGGSRPLGAEGIGPLVPVLSEATLPTTTHALDGTDLSQYVDGMCVPPAVLSAREAEDEFKDFHTPRAFPPAANGDKSYGDASDEAESGNDSAEEAGTEMDEADVGVELVHVDTNVSDIARGGGPESILSPRGPVPPPAWGDDGEENAPAVAPSSPQSDVPPVRSDSVNILGTTSFASDSDAGGEESSAAESASRGDVLLSLYAHLLPFEPDEEDTWDDEDDDGFVIMAQLTPAEVAQVEAEFRASVLNGELETVGHLARLMGGEGGVAEVRDLVGVDIDETDGVKPPSEIRVESTTPPSESDIPNRGKSLLDDSEEEDDDESTTIDKDESTTMDKDPAIMMENGAADGIKNDEFGEDDAASTKCGDTVELASPEDAPLVEAVATKVQGTSSSREMKVFHLPIVYCEGRTGFEPTKDFEPQSGTLVAGRYLVQETLGSAAFSTAYRCIDLDGDEEDEFRNEVCLKVIKNSKDFFDQSLDEIKILQKLNESGDCDSHKIVKMMEFFYFKEHLIIVTELLRQNLYEFNKFIMENEEPVYFNRRRLCYITRQLLIALEYVHNLDLVHCDIKPENILMSSYSRCEVKLIDFGSSCYRTDHFSSYIQSRSYRAPEVVLGLPYDGKIDIWSLGCVIAEMYSGRVIFQNESVVTMLARIQAICGRFPRHMLEGREAGRYFTNTSLLYEKVYVRQQDEDEEEEVSDRRSTTSDEDCEYFEILVPKMTTLSARLGFDPDLMEQKERSANQEERALFTDFVGCLLSIDPAVRPNATEALNHPWILSGLHLSNDDVKYPPEDDD
mmetsp:Transcript_1923/g.4119  ORF Transcript_1923/g.4119 Transcript_1923/m.4119 type:complete len:1435 (-) Transcript_1923:42-4346(-)